MQLDTIIVINNLLSIFAGFKYHLKAEKVHRTLQNIKDITKQYQYKNQMFSFLLKWDFFKNMILIF